jgi:hypothetical protein
MERQIGSKSAIPNPALKEFEKLVGEWETTGTHPFFPDADLRGRVIFEWFNGGSFLTMRSEIDHPKFPDGVAVFGSDDQSGRFYMLYFDERGTSRKYDVTVAPNQITWEREDPHFSQKFVMTINGTEMTSEGKMSRDGGEWEKDLCLCCTRK